MFWFSARKTETSPCDSLAISYIDVVRAMLFCPEPASSLFPFSFLRNKFVPVSTQDEESQRTATFFSAPNLILLFFMVYFFYFFSVFTNGFLSHEISQRTIIPVHYTLDYEYMLVPNFSIVCITLNCSFTYKDTYIYMYKSVFFTLRHFFLFRPRVFPRVLGSMAHREPARTPYASLGPGQGPWHVLWGFKVAHPVGEAFRAHRAIQAHANPHVHIYYSSEASF